VWYNVVCYGEVVFGRVEAKAAKPRRMGFWGSNLGPRGAPSVTGSLIGDLMDGREQERAGEVMKGQQAVDRSEN
jgi:hypothetical protein